MLKHFFNEIYEIFMNFILILTYYLDLYHYSYFKYVIKNINLNKLNEHEKLRLQRPKAQNNETTFSNYNSLIEYFSDYIINHNKYLFALIPFTEKHYQILRTNSSYLSIQTPVINKIKAYLEETCNDDCDSNNSNNSNNRYNNIKSTYTKKCAKNDLHLHTLMCTTHLMKDSINRIFIYKNINIEHYKKCPICKDESIWFVNCGTKEDYYETKMNQIKEYLEKIKNIMDPTKYNNEEILNNIINECNCTQDEAKFLISLDEDQKILLVLNFLNIDKNFFQLYKEEKSKIQTNTKSNGCPFSSKSNTQTNTKSNGCPFSKKTE